LATRFAAADALRTETTLALVVSDTLLAVVLLGTALAVGATEKVEPAITVVAAERSAVAATAAARLRAGTRGNALRARISIHAVPDGSRSGTRVTGKVARGVAAESFRAVAGAAHGGSRAALTHAQLRHACSPGAVVIEIHAIEILCAGGRAVLGVAVADVSACERRGHRPLRLWMTDTFGARSVARSARAVAGFVAADAIHAIV
jgi:hypothetical protein